MTQEQKQVKRAKRYRILKVLFYFLGLPLFIFTVFLTSISMLGHAPYVGTSKITSTIGTLTYFESLLTSPALYGFWLAVVLWLTVSIIHIILSKTVKNRRVRLFTVLVCIFVFMFGGTLLMDTVLDAKLTNLAASAPEGVTIDDYKTELSYYRAHSAQYRDDRTLSLIDAVKNKLNVYNVGLTGGNSGGTATNMENKPITYYNIISDDGETGVDISFRKNNTTGFWELDYDPTDGHNVFCGTDGISKDVEGAQLIRLKPNSAGMLEINGKIYSHYYWVNRGSMQGQPVYIWYTKDMVSDSFTFDPATGVRQIPTTEGPYGPGVYTKAGMLNDGWIFGLDNVMRILEDYYEAQQAFAEWEKQDSKRLSEVRAEMFSSAAERRERYYHGELVDQTTGEAADEWLQALYEQESDYQNRFSLTHGRLDALISQVAALLGDNSLFDYLLKNADELDITYQGFNIGEILAPILKDLAGGMSLRNLLTQLSGIISGMDVDKICGTVAEIFNYLMDRSDIKDIYIVLVYKAQDPWGHDRNNLYLAVVKDNGADAMGTEDDILFKLDLMDALDDPEDPASEYKFDLDKVSKFLSTALNNLLTNYNGGSIKGIVNTVLDLLSNLGILVKDVNVDGVTYKGINILGFDIPLIKVERIDENTVNYIIDIDIGMIARNILSSLYDYTSSIFLPVWEFYDAARWGEDANEYERAVQQMQCQYERAYFEGAVYGKMIASTVIGDSLGTGNYPSSFGFQNLNEVRQFMIDLTYLPKLYPMLAFRDMMLMCGGFVILFYLCSFIAAEKEEQYASGQLVVKKRKKKDKNKKKEESFADEMREDIAALKILDDQPTLFPIEPEQTADTKDAEDMVLPDIDAVATDEKKPAEEITPDEPMATEDGLQAKDAPGDGADIAADEVKAAEGHAPEGAPEQNASEATALPVNENTDKEVH